VLIVYDGWVSLRLRDAVFVVVGPVLAIFISHVFASSLVQHMELGRRPTRREWIGTVVFESRFLLLAVPPVAILVILDLATVSLSDSIRAIIWLEALSLALWTGIAAPARGSADDRLHSLCWPVSGVVLGLQVIIEPGKAVQGGVASAAASL
jgi:hypothetical protein